MFGKEACVAEKFAYNLAGRMLKEKLIAEELVEWYVYSFVSILETAFCLGTMLLLSVILNNTLKTVFF